MDGQDMDSSNRKAPEWAETGHKVGATTHRFHKTLHAIDVFLCSTWFSAIDCVSERLLTNQRNPTR